MENKYLHEHFNIDRDLLSLADEAEARITDQFKKIEEISRYNQYKVIKAFHDNRVSDTHFMSSTGYGYGDIGREKLDDVFKTVFKGEDALVRQSIASGTVAIYNAIAANLHPGDEILFITGLPYDTLIEATGIRGNQKGSLKDYGISAKVVELTDNGSIDYDSVRKNIGDKTKMIFLQRSRGYHWRNPVMCSDIEKVSQLVKNISSQLILFVDNCYCEFVETVEPLECGADLIAGSLIKNPGGGLAPSGGYIVGKKELIENCASRIYSPGLHKEVGSSITDKRLLFQGLYMAPKVVAEALKGAVFTAGILDLSGYETSPSFNDTRGDIVQLVKFEKKEQLIKFCQSIQKSSPIDAHVTPYPWDMPGYQDQVIMAAGTFVQGASIELSADAPIKEPYIAYIQGGLVYSQVKLAILLALQSIKNNEII
ncbi:MAG: methionine gamma-lyase family protein [Clostridia bacterium]|nr:methionine gamma-lyase family protein [Clostridia bacterium]